jgi:hypothetical protein
MAEAPAPAKGEQVAENDLVVGTRYIIEDPTEKQQTYNAIFGGWMSSLRPPAPRPPGGALQFKDIKNHNFTDSNGIIGGSSMPSVQEELGEMNFYKIDQSAGRRKRRTRRRRNGKKHAVRRRRRGTRKH